MGAISDEERRQLLREAARLPGGTEIVCVGRSMEPTIMLGERVRVRACERPRAGDVVLLEISGGDAYVLHRVILVVPGTEWLVHAGDGGTPGQAGVARLAQVVGRATLPRRASSPRTYATAVGTLVAGAARRLGRRLGRRR